MQKQRTSSIKLESYSFCKVSGHLLGNALRCICGCVCVQDSRPTQAAKVSQSPWGHEEGNRVFHTTFLACESGSNFKGIF